VLHWLLSEISAGPLEALSGTRSGRSLGLGDGPCIPRIGLPKLAWAASLPIANRLGAFTGYLPDAQSPDPMPDVIAVGDVNVDIIAEFSTFPEQGGDSLARTAVLHCGGSAANTAMSLARLGLTVSLISRVGPDPWASTALRCLEETGVRLDLLQRDPSVMTGLMYVVVTPGGERTILGSRGANVMVDPGHIHAECFREARLLHLSGYSLLDDPQRTAALLALDMAGESGLSVSLDPGMTVSDRAMHEMLRILPRVDVFLPTLAEARYFTGRTEPESCAQQLLAMGAGAVAMKLGGAGCLIGHSGGPFRMPAFVVQSRDSTGAGDSFNAGIIAGVLGGLDWHSTAVLANALGAVTTARVGGGAHDSMVPDVLALLRDAHKPKASTESMKAIAQAIEFVLGFDHPKAKE